MITSKLKNVAAVIAAVSGLALGGGPAYAAPTFANGGFEADSWAPGETNQTTVSGWIVVQSDDSRFVDGIHNTADTTFNHTPFGNQFIDLCAGDCSADARGSVSQTVSGFVVGTQYRLDFEHTPEFDDPSTETALVMVTIAGGGTLTNVFDAIDVGVSGHEWTEWKHQSWTFTANSPTLTFTFEGTTDNSGKGNWESGIDNISLTQLGGQASIPTLSEWGLILLSGLLALGAVFTFRRQRQ